MSHSPEPHTTTDYLRDRDFLRGLGYTTSTDEYPNGYRYGLNAYEGPVRVLTAYYQPDGKRFGAEVDMYSPHQRTMLDRVSWSDLRSRRLQFAQDDTLVYLCPDCWRSPTVPTADGGHRPVTFLRSGAAHVPGTYCAGCKDVLPAGSPVAVCLVPDQAVGLFDWLPDKPVTDPVSLCEWLLAIVTEHGDQHDQGLWFRSDIINTPSIDDPLGAVGLEELRGKPACGTTACVAGWASVLAGGKWIGGSSVVDGIWFTTPPASVAAYNALTRGLDWEQIQHVSALLTPHYICDAPQDPEDHGYGDVEWYLEILFGDIDVDMVCEMLGHLRDALVEVTR